MYNKVDTNLNFVQREREILKFWKENDIAKKCIDIREGCDTFTFYDGPPTSNGKPHIGHVLTRVIKDMLPRYQSMKGKKILRKAGWDTHGLPVELEVEKKLGLDGKEQIEKYGIEPFIKECRESVWKYKGMWEEFSDVVGFWADMDNPYITYENNYIESVWWALNEIWKKGLLYKGHGWRNYGVISLNQNLVHVGVKGLVKVWSVQRAFIAEVDVIKIVVTLECVLSLPFQGV